MENQLLFNEHGVAIFQKFWIAFNQPNTVEVFIEKRGDSFRISSSGQFAPICEITENDSYLNSFELDEVIELLRKHDFINTKKVYLDYFHDNSILEEIKMLGVNEGWIKSVKDWSDFVVRG